MHGKLFSSRFQGFAGLESLGCIPQNAIRREFVSFGLAQCIAQILLSCALLFCVVGTVAAQTTDDFNPDAGSYVYSMAVQPDGKILVGGYVATLGGQTRDYIGRLNADGSLDSTFNPGANERVYSLVVQADGKILVGGNFTVLGGQTRNNLGRLNPDGTLDTTFNPGADGGVTLLFVQPDGKILVGGGIRTLCGQSRKYIGRLNPDGSLDTTFNPGASSYVYSMAVQADGKILVGGSFTNLCGQSRNRIGRLNADGSLDTAFNPGASSYVYSMAVQADGKILVGGSFTNLCGQSRNRIGRLNADGSLDPTFNPGASRDVYSIAVQTDGKIVAGGLFTALGGQTRNYIGRLNADGSLDTVFNPGASSYVESLVVQADGKILVGGEFITLGGKTRRFIGRINNNVAASQLLTFDGSALLWQRGGSSPDVWRTTFEYSTNGGAAWGDLGTGSRVTGGWQLPGVSLPAHCIIRARGFVMGGRYSASSWFVESYWGDAFVVSQPLSLTNNVGTTAAFTVVAGGQSLLYQWFKDGVALSDGGRFRGAQTAAITITNVLKADEGAYTLVISNAVSSVTSAVARLVVNDPIITTQPASQDARVGSIAILSVVADGTLPFSYQWLKEGLSVNGATNASLVLTNLQGGNAGVYTVSVRNPYGCVTSSVAYLSVNVATAENGFNSGADGTVYSVAVQADGKILVGGSFSNLCGQPRAYIGRLNADGTLDTTFNPGADGYVYSLAVQADGRILVGGYFTKLGGLFRNCIVRLNADGSIDPSFNAIVSSADSPRVFSIAVQGDGRILIGGFFTFLTGAACNYIGQVNADGGRELAFNPAANNAIWSMAEQSDEKILLGGWFSTLNGQTRNCIARLNADGTLDASFNPGASSCVQCMALQADGKILVGGQFVTLGDQPRNHIGRLNTDGSLDLSFDPGANGFVESLAIQADGKILVGGYFTNLCGLSRNYIGRLNTDGNLDTTFNPGTDGYVESVAVQTDGRILVGGSFNMLDGQRCACIGRLINTVPAIQSFTMEGSTLLWKRDGSTPEVWRTTFEMTTDGLYWSVLGTGTRVSGGWQLSGVSLPRHSSVRARGYATGGFYSASSWLVESYLGDALVISQPSSRTNNAGTTAAFTVVAGGGSLQYQWLKDGMALSEGGRVSGVKTVALTLSNVLKADEGAYTLIISNDTSSVTSAAGHLVVVDPIVVAQPVGQELPLGDSAVLSVTAAGTPPFGYQWLKDGRFMDRATNANLLLQTVQFADCGNYSVTVSNSCGSVTSAVAYISVYQPLTVDTNFNFNAGVGYYVYSTALQTDGKILLGSDIFTGRLNADSSLDTSFNPWPSGLVQSLAMQADGKILMGGQFVTLNGETRKYIGRINSDGSLDTTFTPGANSQIYSLVLQPDSRILVGGWFTNLCGQQRAHIGRINSDGTLDTTFNPGCDGYVYALALQSDGKILVGGNFASLCGQSRTNMGRLNSDGSLDASFNPRVSSLFAVNVMAVQADGKILVGGAFSTLGGQQRTNIGRLNADGSLDTTFTASADQEVYSLALQSDGKILAGGCFTNLCGQRRNYIGRLNTDGSLDSTFSPGVGGGTYPVVESLALQADGAILIGGKFDTLGGQMITNIGRLNNTAPATQSLTFDGSTLLWRRGGSSPEVWRTTFEASTDGTNWTNLGVGKRVNGGWQLRGVSLPERITVRARGFAVGGIYGASSWFVETLWMPGSNRPRLTIAPLAVDHFALSLFGDVGQTLELQATTSPVESWNLVRTFVITNQPLVVPWTNQADFQRFFRVQPR